MYVHIVYDFKEIHVLTHSESNDMFFSHSFFSTKILSHKPVCIAAMAPKKRPAKETGEEADEIPPTQPDQPKTLALEDKHQDQEKDEQEDDQNETKQPPMKKPAAKAKPKAAKAKAKSKSKTIVPKKKAKAGSSKVKKEITKQTKKKRKEDSKKNTSNHPKTKDEAAPTGQGFCGQYWCSVLFKGRYIYIYGNVSK